MPRAEKERKVREIAERLSVSTAAVITDYRGMTVKEAAELRASLDEVDTRLSVVKNTLTKLAVKEAGLDGLTELIDGPTAIAFVQGDPVAGVKRLVEASRRLRMLDLRGGFAEGRILSGDQVRDLATLESREVMLARIAGLGKMQLSRTAWTFQALQSKFVGLMEALRDKLPEMPEAPGEPTPADTETEPTSPGEGPAEPEPIPEGPPADTETEPSAPETAPEPAPEPDPERAPEPGGESPPDDTSTEASASTSDEEGGT